MARSYYRLINNYGTKAKVFKVLFIHLDNLKPVNEAGGDQQNIVYRPGIVGGPSGHIVGLPQAMIKPISDSSRNKNRNIKHNHVHASATHDHAQTNSHIQKPNRGRKLNSNGILSSFLDLLH
ncbi:unnamed protein product, partial [Brenthis ino]